MIRLHRIDTIIFYMNMTCFDHIYIYFLSLDMLKEHFRQRVIIRSLYFLIDVGDNIDKIDHQPLLDALNGL